MAMKFELYQKVSHAAEDPYGFNWGHGIVLKRGMMESGGHDPEPYYYVSWSNRSCTYEPEVCLAAHQEPPSINFDVKK
jgi:hypothetical protein